jgi:hypothetical protein
MVNELTRVFVLVDDFCNIFEPAWNKHLLEEKIKHRCRKNELCLSETMTILIFFHVSGFKSLKKFYLFLQYYHKKEFPNLLSYKRFLVLEKRCFFPLFAFFNFVSAVCDGESFIDSTAMPVCHIKREYVNKVFFNMAKKSKSTMGWFYGFKLHLITNVQGHPISFTITKGNVDDRKVPQSLFSKIFGKIYGDKGYISKEFLSKMKEKMIYIVTAIKSNMKPQIISIHDSHRLTERTRIETVFNVLKNNLNLQHTRHRCSVNYTVNIVGALSAYCLRFLSNFSMVHKCLELNA